MSKNDNNILPKVRRFSKYRITEHWVHVVLFVMLIVTGLSQTYYYLELSQWFVLKLGGIDRVRMVHRATGVGFSVLLIVHIFAAVTGLLTRKWGPDMLISIKDFKDAAHNIRFYFGLETRPARCGRYTYKQKFEYWAIFLGVIFMASSGYLLMYPIRATAYLPGEVIPMAKALHSNEAIVMILIISIWHIYNAVFSPEVFPLDRSMFTGYISRRRMIREHPMELEKEDAEGENNEEGMISEKVIRGV